MCMELDTGASVSIVSEAQYKQWWPGRSLDSSPIKLQTYSKQPLGSLRVVVDYEGHGATLLPTPCGCGREWAHIDGQVLAAHNQIKLG